MQGWMITGVVGIQETINDLAPVVVFIAAGLVFLVVVGWWCWGRD